MTTTSSFDPLITRADALGCDDLVRILRRMQSSACAEYLDVLREALDAAERLRLGEDLAGPEVPLRRDVWRTGMDTLRRLQEQRFLEAS